MLPSSGYNFIETKKINYIYTGNFTETINFYFDWRKRNVESKFWLDN